jgi:hypothetical protein
MDALGCDPKQQGGSRISVSGPVGLGYQLPGSRNSLLLTCGTLLRAGRLSLDVRYDGGYDGECKQNR